MDQSKNDHLGALLLAILSGTALAAFAAGGVFALAAGVMEEDGTSGLFSSFLLFSAFLLASLPVGRGGLLALRRLQNRPGEAARIQPLSPWTSILLFGGWLLAVAIAAILGERTFLQWFSIPFYLLSIGLPIYALVRLAAGGLNAGSQLRAWGTLSAGMTLAPLLALLVEGAAALVLLIVIGVFVGLDAERLKAVQALAEQLKDAASQEEIVLLVGPILANPLTLIGGLFFLSLVTPLAEEIAKSLPVWLAWRKLESPAQGFALGALSGAGFGLMESLFIAANPGGTWAATLTVRAASSAMHIVTAGLTGWGIGQTISQRRVTPVLSKFALSVVVHSVWNACVVILAYASGRAVLSGGAAPNPLDALVIVPAFCFLGLLVLCAPLALWVLNRQLRTSPPAPLL